MVRTTMQNAQGAALSVDAGQVVAALCDPRTYADRPTEITVIETHISWVFLSSRHAYKLKKPVKFDFLDFSTPELRYAACKAELQLNRRLAPDVYLEVVPVCVNKRGRIRLGGNETPVDWVVKMRRLPADRTLDNQIRAGTVTVADVESTAERLADFYLRLPPLSIRTEHYRQHILQHVTANLHDLIVSLDDSQRSQVQRIHAAQVRTLKLWPEMFDDRVCDGRIVEGHGDLRPEHIYLTAHNGPTVIDCIEFNAEFRQIDVLDELSFLAMECEFLDAGWVGDRIIGHYERASSDSTRESLRSFYTCYRACVRAKVQALRAQQTSGDDRRDIRASSAAYLELADRYAARLGPPLLLVVRGLTGVGKSTLACAICESLGIELLQTDVIRRELFPIDDGSAEFGKGVYLPANRLRVYHELFGRAESLLADGRSVILDGTFLTTDLRRRAAFLAQRNEAVMMLIECHCPDDVAAERIALRLQVGDSESRARPDFVVRQRENEEPDPPGISAMRVDTSLSLPAMLDEVYRGLRAMLEAHAVAGSSSGDGNCRPHG